MPATAPSWLTIIKSAMRKLGALGAGTAAPGGEDLEFAVDTANEIIEQLNLRKRNAFFERNQSFTFGTARQSYSIGTAANSANFVVSAGDRPVTLEVAKIVDTGVTPNDELGCAIVDYEEYKRLIANPALASSFPQIIAYQPTVPNGTIWPYPAFPTSTTWQLNLTWWNQIDTLDIGDVSTALVLPFGYRRGLATKLAIAMWPAFAKRTDLAQLEKQDRLIWADITSVNVTPPNISSTDGIQSGGGFFDYQTRQFQ